MFAVIEMPKGTSYKYELDKTDKQLTLDRIINLPVPYNYGFIPNTLSEDGDPIDVFVVSKEPIPPLTKVKISLLFVIPCIDNGENDEKLVALVEGDPTIYNEFEIKRNVTDYLLGYKTGLTLDYTKYFSLSEAQRLLTEAQERYEQKV